jgi:hypothetical protein
MAVMNTLVRRLFDQIKGKSILQGTPTNNNLNSSPRPLDINQPRTAQFSGANVNSNSYGKSDGIISKLISAKEGGEVLAKGNKLAKHRPTKLY